MGSSGASMAKVASLLPVLLPIQLLDGVGGAEIVLAGAGGWAGGRRLPFAASLVSPTWGHLRPKWHHMGEAFGQPPAVSPKANRRQYTKHNSTKMAFFFIIVCAHIA